MKGTGIVRKIDELGRICLPKELRITLGIKIRDPIEIYVEGRSIVLKKYEKGCTFCSNDKRELVEFYPDKWICRGCVKLIVKEQDKLLFG